jgi:hypothetical protein
VGLRRASFVVEDFEGLTPHRMDFENSTFWVCMYNLSLACMGREMGFKLGSSVCMVEAMGTNEDGVGWGEYLLISTQVSVLKRLPKGTSPYVLHSNMKEF